LRRLSDAEKWASGRGKPETEIIVIPGRRAAANPESIVTIGEGFSRPVIMDSGSRCARPE
jgi:hypothetical protein